MRNNSEIITHSIPFLVLKYAIPNIVGMLSSALYIVVDGIFIGNSVGSGGLASINLVMPAFSFVAGLGLMASVGGGTMVSISMGRQDMDRARQMFRMTLSLLAGISLLALLASFAAGEPVARFLGADASVLPGVLTYLRILSVFLPAFLGSFFLDYMLRATGHPRTAMVTMAGTSLLNILLDYLFIVVAGQGIAGAALATGLAQSVGFSVMVFLFSRGKNGFSLRPGKVRLSLAARALYNGSSEFFSEISYGVSTLLCNRGLMRTAGISGVSAFAVVGYINVMIAFVIIGLATSLQPLISVNHGAGREDRVRGILRWGYLYGLIFTGLVMILILNSRRELAALFIPGEDAVLGLTIRAMGIIISGFAFMCINIISSSFFTAIEWAGTSMVISVSRGIVLITAGLFLLPLVWGLDGIWMTQPAAELLTCLMAILLIRRRMNRTPLASGRESAKI